jgi:uncharacterized protein (TIGR00255 family)
MTGFAERSFSSPTLRTKISIKSLNHRFLDWNYKGLPIGEVESRLRAICHRKLHRGRIEVALELYFPHPSSWEVVINEGLLEKILASLKKISPRLGKEPEFSIENIFRIPQLVEFRRKEFSAEEISFLEKSFDHTLDDVLKARRREGRETWEQLKKHIQTILQSVARIKKLAKKQPSFIREKLRLRLKELDVEPPFPDQKLTEEAAYLAQRYDMAEEILRLKSHVDAIRNYLRAKNIEPLGKNLDFLAQELYREANTINSKSQDIEIIKESLKIKGEVESIRQHVQNIE